MGPVEAFSQYVRNSFRCPGQASRPGGDRHCPLFGEHLERRTLTRAQPPTTLGFVPWGRQADGRD